MPTKRDEQAARARQKLLETGTRLISQNDFDRLKVSDVARECGVSVGLFYHYFPSKEDFFLEVGDARYYGVEGELLEHGGTHPVEDLKAYLNEVLKITSQISTPYTKFYFGHADATTSTTSAAHVQDDLSSLPIISRRIEVIDRYLKKAVESGILDAKTPTREVARLCAASIAGALACTYLTNEGDLLGAWPATFDVLVEGLLGTHLSDTKDGTKIAE